MIYAFTKVKHHVSYINHLRLAMKQRYKILTYIAHTNEAIFLCLCHA